jgi:diaminobutyrate-2-oxoglutarate transaminase
MEKAEYLRRRLDMMVAQFEPHLVRVKGRGMMQGILCADPKRAAAITATAFKHGLIIERAGPEDEVIKCIMPITTSLDVLDEGLDMLERAIEDEFARGAKSTKIVKIATPLPARGEPHRQEKLEPAVFEAV